MTTTISALTGRARDEWGALDPVQQELLMLRAQGMSVAAAARIVHVSRRTAWRRLAEARIELGVGSNADAVRTFVGDVGPRDPR
jgi:DNA-directed RNA polymerase specialized sigma24 family protein